MSEKQGYEINQILQEMRADYWRNLEAVEEAAAVFLRILQGSGTEAQESVVIANAALALYCMDEEKGLAHNVERAARSLKSGAALETFKKLVNL